MNYDPIDTCPYDPAHRIMRSRMQYHLTKCSKNWPCSKKKQCPYDARHIINQIEFNYHVSTCPQRESVWRYKIIDNEEIQPPKILPIDLSPAAAITEENWEEDGKVQTYDPMKHTENRPFTRILIGASKSQRKKHRLQERRRIARLEDAPTMEKESATQRNSNQRAPSSMIPSIPEETSAETEQEYKPLRRPKKLPLDISRISVFSTVNDSAVVNQTQNSVNQNESLQYIQEKSNTNDLNLQRTFSYAAAAKSVRTNQRQQNSNIESDYDVVIESIKYDTEKENNSSFFNKNKDLDLQTTTSNYAAAAKNVPTNQRYRNSSIGDHDVVIDSIKCNTEKKNSSLFFNKNKERPGLQTTSNYATAAKNVPTNQHHQNSSSGSDQDVVIDSIKYDTGNNSSIFNNTIDDNLVKVTKTVEALAIDDEGHKVQSASLDRTLESLKKQNYSSVANNGIN